MQSIYLYPPIYLSIYLFVHLSIYPSIYLSIYLFIHLSIYLVVYLTRKRIYICIYIYVYVYTTDLSIHLFIYRFINLNVGTGWRRLIGCLKLQVIFHKRAHNHRAHLQKMTYKDKASYDSTPPCIHLSIGSSI